MKMRISAGFSFLIMLFYLSSFSHAVGSGFTITSIDTTGTLTRETDPSTVYWLVNVHVNGGGQSILGAITPDETKQFTKNGIGTKWPLSIQITTNSESVFYDVINVKEPIYKYNLVATNDAKKTIGNLIIGAPDPCPAGVDWDLELGKSFLQFPKMRYCIEKVQVGTKGEFENPTQTFNAQIRVEANNQVREKSICSGAVSGCDGSAIDFGSVGTATWTGSLVTGESPPNQDNYVAILKKDSTSWNIARKSTWEEYFPLVPSTDTELNSLITEITNIKNAEQGDEKVNALLTPVNAKADELLREDVQFPGTSSTKDVINRRVLVALDRALQSPNIIFRLRADWLGIVIPTGKPKIQSVSSDRFGSGEKGTINVQITNIGEGVGIFSAELAGCDPFIQTTTAQTSRKTFNQGAVDTITIGISGGQLSQDMTKECSVRVYDVNDPSMSDLRSVTLQFESAKVCQPGKYSVDGNSIKKCNSDGSAIEIVENCQYGVSYDSLGGNYYCNPPPQKESSLKQTDASREVSSNDGITGEVTGGQTDFTPFLYGGTVAVIAVIAALVFIFRPSRHRSAKTSKGDDLDSEEEF